MFQCVGTKFAGKTYLARMDLPRFDASNVREWLFKAEQIFEMDKTDENKKVRLVSIHFDGIAVHWHRSLAETITGRDIMETWKSYRSELLDRFCELCDDPLVEEEHHIREEESTKISREAENNKLIQENESTSMELILISDVAELEQENKNMDNKSSIEQVLEDKCITTNLEIKEALEQEVNQELDERETSNSVQEEEVKEANRAELISPIQVPNLQLEQGLSLVKEECIDSDQHVLMGSTRNVELVKKEIGVASKRMTYQVFDVLVIRAEKFKHHKPSLIPKCWKFKFKFGGLHLFGGSTYNGTIEQWLEFFLQQFLVIDTQYDNHFLVNNELKGLQQLKKSKLLKTWWFKYKGGTRLEKNNIRFYQKIRNCRIQSSRDLRCDYAYVKLQPYRQQTLVVRSNKKLSPKNYGLYKVVDKCRAVAYKLQQMVKVQEIDSTNGKSVNLHLANGASCSGLFYDVGRPLIAKGVGRKIIDKMNETFHSNLEAKEIAYGSKKTLLAHGALPNNKIDGDSKQTNEKHDGLKENKKMNREAMEIGYGVDAYVWRKNMNGTCELQFKWILLLFFGSIPRPPEQGM